MPARDDTARHSLDERKPDGHRRDPRQDSQLGSQFAQRQDCCKDREHGQKRQAEMLREAIAKWRAAVNDLTDPDLRRPAALERRR